MICDVLAAESSAALRGINYSGVVCSLYQVEDKIRNKVTNIQPAKPQLNHFALE